MVPHVPPEKDWARSCQPRWKRDPGDGLPREDKQTVVRGLVRGCAEERPNGVERIGEDLLPAGNWETLKLMGKNDGLPHRRVLPLHLPVSLRVVARSPARGDALTEQVLTQLIAHERGALVTVDICRETEQGEDAVQCLYNGAEVMSGHRIAKGKREYSSMTVWKYILRLVEGRGPLKAMLRRSKGRRPLPGGP
ncbi:hypothetical protein scyTo_0002647 [Scyliorhinus torazame]|uniref:Uncharacterized protein n=1 Tax=Scyliorhinus torazame TaxID=75743 RepID=A0A401PKA5_SCYTO|nr:hypothetical protein [Scyliorhinus torazame]